MKKEEKKAVENMIGVLSNGLAHGFSKAEAKGAVKALKLLFNFDDNKCSGFDSKTVASINRLVFYGS